MEIDKFVSGYKVRAFNWIDGENIYVNVQYYKPGSGLSQPPAFDKSALILNTEKGREFVFDFTDTCVNYIARLNIPAGGMAKIVVGG